MSAEEYQAFKADIAEHGLREPIWTYQGKIIDGQHRYSVRGIEGDPRFQEWDGEEDLIGFIFSRNVIRVT
jgi:hypothetical protein